MKIGLIAIAGVKIQTRKFIELGVTLPQFVSRGRVIAQLPSLALLTLAGATPDDVDVEYVEVDQIEQSIQQPRRDFDLVALSMYTARALPTAAGLRPFRYVDPDGRLLGLDYVVGDWEKRKTVWRLA